MANIGEKANSILKGNLNSGIGYLITTVLKNQGIESAIFRSQGVCVSTFFLLFFFKV